MYPVQYDRKYTFFYSFEILNSAFILYHFLSFLPIFRTEPEDNKHARITKGPELLLMMIKKFKTWINLLVSVFVVFLECFGIISHQIFLKYSTFNISTLI